MADDEKLNINSIFERASISPTEHPDERRNRLDSERAARKIENGKNIAAYVLVMILIASAVSVCGYEAVFDQTAPLDRQKWAQSLVTIIISSAVSFFIGRKTAGK